MVCILLWKYNQKVTWCFTTKFLGKQNLKILLLVAEGVDNLTIVYTFQNRSLFENF